MEELRYALRVLHKGEYKMVCRLYETSGLYVCLHEERVPSQEHYLTASLGGVDYDVLEQLEDWRALTGRVCFIHRFGKTGPAFALWADEVPLLGPLQHWDDRHRYFPPTAVWQPVDFSDDTYCPLNFDIEPRWHGVPGWKPVQAPTPKPEKTTPQMSLSL
jgi:hypothetical protein